MAKKYTWEIEETVTNVETEKEELVVHKVSLECSYLLGKAIINIDGDEFNISTRPFGLKGTNQVFRLGEMAAIIDFPKSGEPDIVIDGKYVRSGKDYN
jgi:hypothetical protein